MNTRTARKAFTIGGTPLPEDALRRAVHPKRERTFEQDPKYPIRLLVDIAIKAPSQAINDPTTAVQTIDQLEDLLRRLGAPRPTPATPSMNRALRLVHRRPGRSVFPSRWTRSGASARVRFQVTR
jgi:uncharacterized membrane protein